jgi:hypothetical protein
MNQDERATRATRRTIQVVSTDFGRTGGLACFVSRPVALCVSGSPVEKTPRGTEYACDGAFRTSVWSDASSTAVISRSFIDIVTSSGFPGTVYPTCVERAGAIEAGDDATGSPRTGGVSSSVGVSPGVLEPTVETGVFVFRILVVADLLIDNEAGADGVTNRAKDEMALNTPRAGLVIENRGKSWHTPGVSGIHEAHTVIYLKMNIGGPVALFDTL